MKDRVYQELNAHVRDNDQKTFWLNALYLSILTFAFSNGQSMAALDYFFSATFGPYWKTIGLLALGYFFQFLHFWYRSWKFHYMTVIHAFWVQNQSAMGEEVPFWHKTKPKFSSFDLLIRSGPFFVNALIILEGCLRQIADNADRVLLVAGFLLLHLTVTWLMAVKLLDVRRFSA
ncbi:MAG: hypothetical protein JNN02_02015 [Tabrizicola sp.]|nr:hypothetical protein [Tabrizicola sp.]